MHKVDKAGNHVFEGERKRDSGVFLECYQFNKENYEKHVSKHNISGNKALEEIDEAIFNPDIITAGPNPKQFNLFRVKWYKDGKHGERAICLWRVHCFQESRRVFTISTAFEAFSPIQDAIHYLDKNEVLWRKPGSKI